MPVFEVFAQEHEGGQFAHSGNVVAPDMEFAMQFARNNFARREEAVRLWLVPREAIQQLSDLDILQPPGDHRYRMGRYYRATTEKRRRLKARVEEASA